MEFSDRSFDAVIALELLEHLNKEEGYELIHNMERWARSKVIVSTPNGFCRMDVVTIIPFRYISLGGK